MNTKLLNVALVTLLLTLTACGKNDGNEAKVSHGPGGSVELKDKDGKTAVVANAKGIALPEDFPKDMPVMKDAVAKMTIDAGSNRIVTFSVGVPVADVLAFYQENLKAQGWKIDSTMSAPESAILTASKAGGQALVTIAKDGKETSIQLTAPKAKP